MAASVSSVVLADVTPPASVWKAAAGGGYELLEALWDSLDAGTVALSDAQAREIDSRVAMLDANPQDGRDAFQVLADFRRGSFGL
jgi:putative addiction module component (TIGR02574 family)